MEGLGVQQRVGAELTGGQGGRHALLHAVFSAQGERGGFHLHVMQDTRPLSQADQHDKTGNHQKHDGFQLPVFLMSRTRQDIHGQ